MKKKKISFFYPLFLVSLLIISVKAVASDTVFSIQAGSYRIPENAQIQFDFINKNLPEADRAGLRIQKINDFFAVRFGFYRDRAEAEKNLARISSLLPEAYILGVHSRPQQDTTKGKISAFLSPAQKPNLSKNSHPLELFSLDPEATWSKAKALAEKGDFKAAVALLSPFAQEPLMYPVLVSDYLVMMIWKGDQVEAIRQFESLPSTFPKRAYLLKNMAKAYYDLGNFIKARTLYQSVVEQIPDDETAQIGLIRSLLQIRENSQALLEVEKALKVNPESLSLGLLKARSLIMQQNDPGTLTVFHEMIARNPDKSEIIFETREDLFGSIPGDRIETLLQTLSKNNLQRDLSTRLDYIWLLIFQKKYSLALAEIEKDPFEIQKLPPYLSSWIAWAHFKNGQVEKAKTIYQQIYEKKPDYLRAKLGLAYCLAAGGEGDKALLLVDPLLQADPKNLDTRFARAFIFEKMRRFWPAIQEYEEIIKLSPSNSLAMALKLQALSDLGASSLALEQAQQVLPQNRDLEKTLQGDMAMDRINWDEPEEAKLILSPLLNDPKNLRARFDYLVALVEHDDMKEGVKAYEELCKEKIPIPYWVLQQVASAYLYLEEPEQALELYNKVLEEQPTSFVARMGKFYTLQEIRKWEAARDLLYTIDRETPSLITKDSFAEPNWPKLDLVLTMAWMLSYEGRLGEAESAFWDLRQKAPGHMGIRSGLSQIYLWRGWPRKSLREFSIVHSLEPNAYKFSIGRAVALNELVFKKESRELADSLYKEHPTDKHVQQLKRRFEVEDKNELTVDFVLNRDDAGYEEYKLLTTLTSLPIRYRTRFYAFLLWQESSFENQLYYYRRTGVGVTHLFNQDWSFRQHFSVDYDGGGNFGSYSQVQYTPNDYWRWALSYDSYSTEIPLRARIFGITGNLLQGQVAFRESEWRNYYLTLNYFYFSDGNERSQGLLGYEQGLWHKNDWRLRLSLDLYASKNTRSDAPYFNPSEDLSFSATYLTEYTHLKIYNKAFVQKLFLTLGTYIQSGYDTDFIWSIRYQQDIDFCDTHAWLWGLSYGRKVYDGNPVYDYTFYLTYRWRF